MSSNMRCKFVLLIAIIVMIAIGAFATYGATIYLGRWAGIVVVALIAICSSPDLEICVFAAILVTLAWVLSSFFPPSILLLPGGVAGALMVFRAGPVIEWLYPPLGQPPGGS